MKHFFAPAVIALCLASLPTYAATEQVLYSFAVNDGAEPLGTVVIDKSGSLIGTTRSGGATDGGGNGTVFRFMPSGETQEQELHCFCSSSSDGIQPEAEVVFSKGAYYGTTIGAPYPYRGTVFKLQPPKPGQTAWRETVIYSFAGPSYPAGGLIADKKGALYGVLYSGCPGCGLVYRLTPPSKGSAEWTYYTLYTFNGAADGGDPSGTLIFDKAGALYGTTLDGGPTSNNGIVYKLTPPGLGESNWTKTTLYEFGGLAAGDGKQPVGGVVMDKKGNLYGATQLGGQTENANNLGHGTVFKLSPPSAGATGWSEAVLHRFGGQSGGGDGDQPTAHVVFDKFGALYGTTYSGGVGAGTVFKLSPPPKGNTAWTESILHSFGLLGSGDGRSPFAPVTIFNNGVIYGTTSGGGNDWGTVFSIVQ